MLGCPSLERLEAFCAELRKAWESDAEIDDPEQLEVHCVECEKCGALFRELTAGGCAWLDEALTSYVPGANPDSNPLIGSLIEKLQIPALDFLGPGTNPNDLGSLGRYRILEVLGRGGMGIVLKAWDDALERPVAIKVLNDRNDNSGREKILQEARKLAKVKHENVIGVFDVYAAHDPPYLVMEYVAGRTLAARLEDARTCRPIEIAKICLEIASGLQALHEKDCIHGDIKPANVMLDNDGRAKILDLGLAQRINLPNADVRGRTPGYASPEQSSKPERISKRTDLFSLGVTLYEALTGEMPYGDGTTSESIVSPLPPRQINRSIPRNLEAICLKCLNKEPADRYTAARSLALDLQLFLENKPVQARAASFPERSWLFCRRHSRATLACSILGLVVGVTAWQWQLFEGREAELRARKQFEQLQGEINRSANEHLDTAKGYAEIQQRVNEMQSETMQLTLLLLTRISPDDPDFRRILERLKKQPDLPDEKPAGIPVSKQRTAVAAFEGREFQKVVDSLPEDLIQAQYRAVKEQQAKAAEEIERAVTLDRIRGDTLQQLEDWKAALVCYQRIAQVKPSFGIIVEAAYCQLMLGQADDAIKGFDTFIAALDTGGKEAQMSEDMALALCGRGMLLMTPERSRDALLDFNRAVPLLAQQVEENKRHLAGAHIRGLTCRGKILHYRSDLRQAEQDFDRAISQYKQCVDIPPDSRKEAGNIEDLSFVASEALTARGAVFIAQNKFDLAVQDYDRAISIIGVHSQQSKQQEQQDPRQLARQTQLANCLYRRGLLLVVQDEPDLGMRDFNQAIGHFAWLGEKQKQNDVRNQYAHCLLGRGYLLADRDENEKALDDFSKGISLFEQLAKKDDRAEQITLAEALRERARLLINIDGWRVDEAIADLGKAINIFDKHKQSAEPKLALCLGTRGSMFAFKADLFKKVLGNNDVEEFRKDAIADLDNSIGILTRIIPRDGRADLEKDLHQFVKVRDQLR